MAEQIFKIPKLDFSRVPYCKRKVLDLDVQGKAARGYLWFYDVLGSDVILHFDPSYGLAPVRNRLDSFVGTVQTYVCEVCHSLERNRSNIQRIAFFAHARRYSLFAPVGAFILTSESGLKKMISRFFASGRWLFMGHPDAGWRSAVNFSILVSLFRGINLQENLTDVFDRLP
jgi:hypothetical protein